jgi:hypothetical protein
MSALRSCVLALSIGCGAASAPAETTPAPSAESETCCAERLATMEAMAASRARSTCGSAADCAIVTSPMSASPEDDEVVALADAASLEARAEAHLETCGAFAYHAAIDAYREVAAACVEGHCAIEETLVHVPPIDE